jgi:hypothetical protein
MKTLADHIMDIAQNSTRAGATLVMIDVVEDKIGDTLTIRFTDNGCGMDAETLARVADPFFTSRTTRKVGLGIPLLQQNAEMTGGNIAITSEVGKGTVLKATFGLTHIDRPPWGDLGGTIALLASGHPTVDIVFSHQLGNENYVFDTRDIKRELDGVPINTPKIASFLTEMVRENLAEIGVE